MPDSDIAANNRRIAKNTLYLYGRMLIGVAVSLYTSRITLNALGVEDYGVYNVVGGIMSLFWIVTGSMTAAIGRFITFELGRGDMDRLRRTFASSVTIMLFLSLLIILVTETVGVWFLNNRMVIPQERMFAANWVLQLTMVSFVISLVCTSYNACVTAHEKMSAFAYISLFDAFTKLLCAMLITRVPFDKLIFIASYSFIIGIIVRIIYGSYCKRHFEECHYRFIFDRQLLKQMFGFAGWNFIGAASAVLRDQGGNIILNLYGGPIVNAARGIAMRVSGVVGGFASNFTAAMNPQITKYYAQGDNKHTMDLLFRGGRLAYYMLLMIALPVLINTEYVLWLWLGQIPEHAPLFLRLVLLFSMSDIISGPLITAMLATGNIRNYQIVVGGLQMLNLPVSYILLRIGCIPETVMIVAIVLSQCCLAARLFMLRSMIGLPSKLFLRNVYMNVVMVSIIAAALPILFALSGETTLPRFIVSCSMCLVCTVLAILYVGCSRQERKTVGAKIYAYRKKYLRI